MRGSGSGVPVCPTTRLSRPGGLADREGWHACPLAREWMVPARFRQAAWLEVVTRRPALRARAWHQKCDSQGKQPLQRDQVVLRWEAFRPRDGWSFKLRSGDSVCLQSGSKEMTHPRSSMLCSIGRVSVVAASFPWAWGGSLTGACSRRRTCAPIGSGSARGHRLGRLAILERGSCACRSTP